MLILFPIEDISLQTHTFLSQCMFVCPHVDIDYFTPPSRVTIPAGRTSASFTISTRGDRILEYDESFVVTAYPPVLPEGRRYCNATVVILDDDCKLLIYAKCDKTWLIKLKILF